MQIGQSLVIITLHIKLYINLQVTFLSTLNYMRTTIITVYIMCCY